jgi:hypothetical protein
MLTRPGDLGHAQREEALRRMADEEFDVLVIGGGVVGAGSVLDAATRGLSLGAGRSARLRRRDFQPAEQALGAPDVRTGSKGYQRPLIS